MQTKKSIPLRRISREWILSILYQIDLREEPLSPGLLDAFFQQIKSLENGLGEREISKISKITVEHVQGILDNLSNSVGEILVDDK